MVWITVYRYFLFENDIAEFRLVYFRILKSILLQACGATIDADSETDGEINLIIKLAKLVISHNYA